MSSIIEKEVDFADYDKDEPEESKAAAEAAVNAAASKVAKKVDADDYDKLVAENKKLKEELATKSVKKTRAPKGLYKTQCEDAIKKIKHTIKYIKDNHNVHLECYMLGLYLKDITDDLPESDDHDAYKRGG